MAGVIAMRVVWNGRGEINGAKVPPPERVAMPIAPRLWYDAPTQGVGAVGQTAFIAACTLIDA